MANFILDRVEHLSDLIGINKINHFLWRFTFMLGGLPRYSRKELKSYTNCNPEDFRVLKLFDTRFHLVQIIFMAIQVTIASKNLTYPIYSLVQIEKLNSLREKANGSITSSQTFEFNCLRTNCTQFRRSVSIFDDLIRLPWLRLCHPNYVTVLNPFSSLTEFGLNTSTFLAYFILVLSLILPIELYVKKIHQEQITLMIAPNAVLRSNANRIRRYFLHMFSSTICFYYENKLKEFNESANVWDNDKHSARQHSTMKIHDPPWQLRNEEISSKLIRSDVGLLDEKFQSFLDDCLPITRKTKWYRAMCILSVVRTFGAWAVISIPIILTTFACSNLMEDRRALYDEIEHYIGSRGCNIWIKHHDSFDGRYRESIYELDFRSLLTSWNLYHLLELFFMLSPSLLYVCSGIISQLAAVEELQAMHTEQMDRTKLILRLTRVLRDYVNTEMTSQSSGLNIETSSNDFNIRTITKIHDSNLNIVLFFPYLKPITEKELDKIAIDCLIENGVSLDVVLNLMSKVYIGNRFLLYSIKQCVLNLNIILTYCYAIGYGLALSYVFWSRKLQQSDLYSGCLSVVGLLFSNIIVSYVSRIQAQSRLLIKSMWMVVADCQDYKDIRMRHMRSLWTRQAVVFLCDGNIVLRAFGIPVSHANVAELLLWSWIAVIIFGY